MEENLCPECKTVMGEYGCNICGFEKPKFNVFTYEILDKEQMGKYVHWAEGLKMVITKGNAKIELNSEEIQQVVNALPRTLGGTYK